MAQRRAQGEGTIYHDAARNKWVGAITINGRRRKVSAATKADARKRLEALRSDADRGSVGDGNATVADAVDRWERRVLAGMEIAPSTRMGYQWCTNMIRDTIGKKRLRTLTADDVEAMFDHLATTRKDGRTLGRSALVKVRSVLGQVLDYAERRGLVVRNVARAAEMTPTARRTAVRRALDPAQARQLLAALEGEPLGAMFMLSLLLGLRPGESAGLHWADVDLDAGTVTLRHAVRMENNRPIVVDELKTARSRRTLTSHPIITDSLRKHRAEQITRRLAAPVWPGGDLVFTTRNGTPLDAANVRRELVRICTDADLPALRPNELRHTAASLMSDAGAPMEQIADQLGHTTTRMLEQTYRHQLKPSINTAVSMIDDVLQAGAS